MNYRFIGLTQGGLFGLMFVLSLLSGCGRYVNAGEVEALVTTEFPVRTGLNITSVSCPSKQPAAVNESFQCSITLEDEQSLNIEVTQQDRQGTITWDESKGIQSIEGVIDNDRLAQDITDGIFAQTEIRVMTDCGTRFRLAKQDEVFSCTTTDAQNQDREIRVVVEDNSGNVSWGL